MAARIAGLRATREWVVLERDDRIIGFASAATEAPAALQWSAEAGAHVDVQYHRADVAWMQLDQLDTADPDGPPGPIG
jgi:hypothetical protein